MIPTEALAQLPDYSIASPIILIRSATGSSGRRNTWKRCLSFTNGSEQMFRLKTFVVKRSALVSDGCVRKTDRQRRRRKRENCNETELEAAHKRSSNHRSELMSSKLCGCFYCKSIFEPSKIVEWIDDDNTALYPFCGIDSVIGLASNFPITPEFLNRMKTYWFS